MALIVEDRVQETSISTGTGAFTLAGAVAGFRTFASVCSTNDTLYYTIQAVDANGVPTGEWEDGLGTYSSANTLTRTTPQRSSNANAAVVFSAGTKRVFISVTGAYLATLAAETTTTTGALINSATAKTTPVDADFLGLMDSAASNILKKLSWAKLKETFIGTVNSWTKAQIGAVSALSVSANAVAVDLSNANNFSLTLQATTGQTLSNPTNAVAGQSGYIFLTQNATPSTLAYGSNWIPFDGNTPNVSTTASAINTITYVVFNSTNIFYSLSKHGVT